MCGRFIVSYTYEELLTFLENDYDITDVKLDYSERYNISPGQRVLSVIKSKDRYKVGYLHWGFIPSFSESKRIGYKMINARSETLKDKPAFRESLRHKRCLILSNGFYEWTGDGDNKTPYLFQREDKKMFVYAGLWSVNKTIEDKPIYSTTIVTKASNVIMGGLHKRMPVMFTNEEALRWLNYDLEISELELLIYENSPANYKHYPVSSYVNNSKHEGVKCIEEQKKDTLF